MGNASTVCQDGSSIACKLSGTADFDISRSRYCDGDLDRTYIGHGIERVLKAGGDCVSVFTVKTIVVCILSGSGIAAIDGYYKKLNDMQSL